jgi:hypothetical protein
LKAFFILVVFEGGENGLGFWSCCAKCLRQKLETNTAWDGFSGGVSLTKRP